MGSALSAAKELRELRAIVAQQVAMVAQLTAQVSALTGLLTQTQKAGRVLSQKPTAVRVRRFRRRQREALHVTPDVTPPERATREKEAPLPKPLPVTPDVTAPSLDGPLFSPDPISPSFNPPKTAKAEAKAPLSPLSSVGYFELRNGFSALFKSATGREYGWTNARDGKAARELLRKAPVHELLHLGEFFFQRWAAAPRGSFERKRVELGELSRVFNELRAAAPTAPAPLCGCGLRCSPACGLTREERMVRETEDALFWAGEIRARNERREAALKVRVKP